MKVILATSISPFTSGGAERLVEWLEEALRVRGHEVEVYRIPVHATSDELLAQTLALRAWDFTGQGDRLIAVRTPSYMVKHHSKVVWFIHHHRPAYDLRQTHPDVGEDESGREYRRMLFAADELALGECDRVFTNSRAVSDRLKRYNGIDSEVLYPPLGEGTEIPVGQCGDALVYVSRLVSHKRQLLAVEAMAHTTTAVRLVVAGEDVSGDYAVAIADTVERLGLQDKVEVRDAYIDDGEKSALLERALGVVYIPEDEDSYGFVGLEAAAARKPVVTAFDSGGVLELVEDGISGFVCESDPRDLARAFDALYEDKARAEAMGARLAEKAAEMKISWDHCIDRLLA